jgi:hypothetical protein
VEREFWVDICIFGVLHGNEMLFLLPPHSLVSCQLIPQVAWSTSVRSDKRRELERKGRTERKSRVLCLLCLTLSIGDGEVILLWIKEMQWKVARLEPVSPHPIRTDCQESGPW